MYTKSEKYNTSGERRNNGARYNGQKTSVATQSRRLLRSTNNQPFSGRRV